MSKTYDLLTLLPGDPYEGDGECYTVIASCGIGPDDIFMGLLLLTDRPPYYVVVEVDRRTDSWEWANEYPNIFSASVAYQDAFGTWEGE